MINIPDKPVTHGVGSAVEKAVHEAGTPAGTGLARNLASVSRAIVLALGLLLSLSIYAQDKTQDLEMKTRIDSVYVFGFDLRESRSAKGGIWNTITGKPETPLNYTKAQKDTVDSVPVIRLFRQVVPGNHPLNGWETWIRKDGKWICADDGLNDEKRH